MSEDEGRDCPCGGEDPPGWHATGWDALGLFVIIVLIWTLVEVMS